ncbi:hypothetical protein OF83DRAFT_1178422 [Amylostereum chailletii]|nr:hypothetical protein OF83DRAFT_1178422 [Amylostereum chailletii]
MPSPSTPSPLNASVVPNGHVTGHVTSTSTTLNTNAPLSPALATPTFPLPFALNARASPTLHADVHVTRRPTHLQSLFLICLHLPLPVASTPTSSSSPTPSSSTLPPQRQRYLALRAHVSPSTSSLMPPSPPPSTLTPKHLWTAGTSLAWIAGASAVGSTSPWTSITGSSFVEESQPKWNTALDMDGILAWLFRHLEFPLQDTKDSLDYIAELSVPEVVKLFLI